MSWFYQKLKELVKGKTPGTLLVTSTEYSGNVYPIISFSELNDIHIGDPDVGTAIDLIAGQVCRGGFETSMDDKYTEKTTDGRTAKELVDDKCQEFGLDQVLKENAADVVGYGESLVWKGQGKAIEFLTRILPATVQNFEFDSNGLELLKVHTLRQDFPAGELVRYSYNRIGKQQLGFGILQALGTTLKIHGNTRASFAEIKAKVQEAMRKQIEDFSSPNQMWVLPDAPDDKLTTYNTTIQKLKQGQRLTYNKPGAQVINAVPERMRGMEMYVEKLWNSFYLALQTPIPQLFAGGQLTQASATAALGVAEIGKIDDLRRYLKRVTEQQIFAVWLEEAGLDPLKAKVRLNWRLLQRPDTNVLLPVLERSREFGDLTRKEMRTIYKDMGLPIVPDAAIEEQPQQQKPKGDVPGMTPPEQPIVSAQKKHQARREEGRFLE
jgi:hypothetical protein